MACINFGGNVALAMATSPPVFLGVVWRESAPLYLAAAPAVAIVAVLPERGIACDNIPIFAQTK